MTELADATRSIVVERVMSHPPERSGVRSSKVR
jgi:hypothetical protein